MSETWVNFTDADVFDPSAAERKSIATVKGRDDLGDICAQVTEQIRQAYVFSSRDLGPDGQIPAGLKSRAVAIALWRFVSEGVAKNEGIQTKSRKDAFDEATKYLDEISRVQIGTATSPSVAAPTLTYQPSSQDGI